MEPDQGTAGSDSGDEAAAGSVVRPGARLGIDVGSVRVGVAVSDPRASLAVPLETVPRASARSGADLDRIRGLLDEYDVVEVVVGLPRSLSGEEGPAAEAARAFAKRLARRIDRPVRLVDERLSTVAAARDLRSAGIDARRGRTVVDQAAAAIVLQTALDLERSTGHPPGEAVAGRSRGTGGSTGTFATVGVERGTIDRADARGATGDRTVADGADTDPQVEE
ncbi:Holliday junction resolvase RuvX [Motilibacter deserti]|uniref:Putative pre-16S rRNA nuclease n=1 Tax=Motilibacter deserti TaxID=2714956 RepID=A0ABX0GWH3_9ACTN|nr:Holliday junction resolvase RuvX [Motilibacter deserti]NHC13985.1 Holliday junction resolvase RuvX [Motilibacter deserti]